MLLQDCNPYIRNAQIQPTIIERTGLRKAYDYRLFYIMENNGSIMIEDQNYPIQSDSVIILPPNTAYDFRGKLKVVVLNFDITRRFTYKTQPIFPPRVSEFDPMLLFETELLDGLDKPMVFHSNGSIRSNVLQIVYYFNSRKPYADAKASAHLKLLFADLLTEKEDLTDTRAEKILVYIRMHAATIRSNEDLAHTIGYHPVYLNDLIKRATGKTLHNILIDAKLQAACQRLTETNESIETISFLSGFCSRTHFCTVFKKKFGFSPTQFRKLHIKQT